MRHEKFKFKDSDGNEVVEVQSYRSAPIYTISMTYEEMIATVNKFANKHHKGQPTKKAPVSPLSFDPPKMWK